MDKAQLEAEVEVAEKTLRARRVEVSRRIDIAATNPQTPACARVEHLCEPVQWSSTPCTPTHTHTHAHTIASFSSMHLSYTLDVVVLPLVREYSSHIHSLPLVV